MKSFKLFCLDESLKDAVSDIRKARWKTSPSRSKYELKEPNHTEHQSSTIGHNILKGAAYGATTGAALGHLAYHRPEMIPGTAVTGALVGIVGGVGMHMAKRIRDTKREFDDIQEFDRNKPTKFNNGILNRTRAKIRMKTLPNHVDSIKEFPEEAGRQISLFQQNAPAGFHEKHRIMPLNAHKVRDEMVGNEVVKRHLDIYHTHLPGVASKFNMTPMHQFEPAIVHAPYQIKDKLDDAKMLIKGKKPLSHSEKLSNAVKEMTALSKSNGLSSLARAVDKIHKEKVTNFHSDNSDLHHLSAEAAHGVYSSEIPKHDMVGPMDLKDFKRHWPNKS